MSSLSAIFDCFTPATYDAFSAHRWLCQLKGHKTNFQRHSDAALYNTSSYRHRMEREKKWLRDVFSQNSFNAAFAHNHMVNLLPLCQKEPQESSYTLLPPKSKKEMEEIDPDGTVRSLPLKCFQNLTPCNSPLLDLRVTAKANQRDRPVRKAAVWTGREPADEIHPYFSLMMTWLIFPQSAQM